MKFFSEGYEITWENIENSTEGCVALFVDIIFNYKVVEQCWVFLECVTI